MRDRRRTALLHHGHPLGVKGLASDLRAKRAGGRAGRAMKYGKVRLLHATVILEFAPQGKVGRLRAREHHHAARLPVEPMHHARTLLAAHTRHFRMALQQKVAQRSVGIAGRTVDDNARRLVDDENVVILIDHHLLQGSLFALVIQQTVAEPLEFGILDLVAELLAHALRFLGALQPARTVPARALKTVLNGLHYFLVWIKRDLHR